jgi:uncharacterized protein (TIGR03435 family)
VARGITLKDMVTVAFNVEDDALKGGEKWLESERFDITAKTAPTESDDALRVMLLNLMIERFGLKTHKDVQPVNVYTLTAVKPKLKEADPAERSTCQMRNIDGARNFACTNMTMAKFAERIYATSAGYLDHPVVDLTELKGSYDFTLVFAPLRRAAAPKEKTPEAAVPTASDPGLGLTLFDAVEKQLGLKLTARKHPMPVVVIDHIERRPTEN